MASEHESSQILGLGQNAVQKLEFIPELYNQLILVTMRFRERDQSSIRSYQRISLGKRKRLVEMIMNEGFSLLKVAKKLKLKLTTARLILKKYKETGTFPMRNFRKRTGKNDKPDEQVTIKEEEVQQQQGQSVEQKEMQQNDIVIEEPPLIYYYFVNQMPVLTCFPQMWPGSMLSWM